MSKFDVEHIFFGNNVPNTFSLVALLVASVALQGCGALSPMEDPAYRMVIYGRHPLGARATTLAIPPDRRLVIFDTTRNKFCAEPSADAAANLSDTFKAALSASATGRISSGQVDAAAEHASSIKQLFFRTQGLQLYRDAMFSLCNAYLNDAIGDDLLLLKQDEALAISAKLIEAELSTIKQQIDSAALPRNQAAGQVPPAAGNAASSASGAH